MVYVDGTGKFDPSLVPGLPKGFVVSRRYLPSEYAREEVKVSVGIATGPHGFGARVTKEEPLLIVVVGDPHDPDFSEAHLREELKEIVERSDGRVVIDGFLKPE